MLAKRDEPLGRVRLQVVGVLFADLVGLTSVAEDKPPEEVMAMLRAFHGRMEDEVFRHGGCLEKFIGDGLLATFGVPYVGTRDATDAPIQGSPFIRRFRPGSSSSPSPTAVPGRPGCPRSGQAPNADRRRCREPSSARRGAWIAVIVLPTGEMLTIVSALVWRGPPD